MDLMVYICIVIIKHSIEIGIFKMRFETYSSLMEKARCFCAKIKRKRWLKTKYRKISI